MQCGLAMKQTLEPLLLSLGAVFVAGLLFGGFVALQGLDPLAVYQTLYLGAFGTRFSIENTLTQAAPECNGRIVMKTTSSVRRPSASRDWRVGSVLALQGRKIEAVIPRKSRMLAARTAVA